MESSLRKVKVGDMVDRFVEGGRFFMALRVTDIDDNYIYCGDWTFSRRSGSEEDQELEWGDSFGKTGTFIIPQVKGK